MLLGSALLDGQAVTLADADGDALPVDDSDASDDTDGGADMLGAAV